MQTHNQNLEGTLRQGIYNQLITYLSEDQTKISNEDAENAMIYGIECYQIYQNQLYNARICLSPISSGELYLINQERNRIDKASFDTIASISFKTYQNLDAFSAYLNTNNYCQLLINRESYDFLFKNKLSQLLFVKGMTIASQLNSDNYNSHVNLSLNKFNENFNDELEDQELKYFASHLGINYQVLKSQIDANKDNTVSMTELKTYLKNRMSGSQFKPIFDKYATLQNRYNERVMGPIDLQKFFKEYQKEDISYLEACQIIIEFNSLENPEKKRYVIQNFEDILVRNKTINTQEIESILAIQNGQNNQAIKVSDSLRLYLTLYEFNMMLHSLLLTVYDQNKLNEKLDLDRPITDYFIKSTHNTYLTQHQLVGKSSSKMYSTSLLYNYRLVELDCYNGDGDDIIITHGYTLVSELSLDEILFELKETAFINSELPVILSIENHLDEKHQIIMANKIKAILGDIFIFPYDQKPKYIPNLRDMCNKFLVKCSGRKVWENEQIPRKIHITSANNSYNNRYKQPQRSKTLVEKKIIFLNNHKFNYNVNPKYNGPNKLTKSHRPVNKTNTTEYQTTTALENIRGLYGVKFNQEKIKSNYYKSWEVITMKCSKALKFEEEFTNKADMIGLTQHCLIKVYPEKFDSSNYNIIKCYSCGMQCCALNIQATDDDYTLYDKIFYKQNGGLGYVLKPDKLCSQKIDIYYDRPKYICHMEIVSLINCSKLIEKAGQNIDGQEELNLKVYSIGIKEDEKNQKLSYKLINGSLFPNFENGIPKIDYNVYDFDLSAIMIKIKYNDKVIGRCCIPYNIMKQGFRRIPIYDISCFNVDEAYMVGYFSLRQI